MKYRFINDLSSAAKNFDITSSAFYEVGMGTELSYTVTSTSVLNELSMYCEQFAQCWTSVRMNLMRLTEMEGAFGSFRPVIQIRIQYRQQCRYDACDVFRRFNETYHSKRRDL